jgi:hypothetical protein
MDLKPAGLQEGLEWVIPVGQEEGWMLLYERLISF